MYGLWSVLHHPPFFFSGFNIWTAGAWTPASLSQPVSFSIVCILAYSHLCFFFREGEVGKYNDKSWVWCIQIVARGEGRFLYCGLAKCKTWENIWCDGWDSRRRVTHHTWLGAVRATVFVLVKRLSSLMHFCYNIEFWNCLFVLLSFVCILFGQLCCSVKYLLSDIKLLLKRWLMQNPWACDLFRSVFVWKYFVTVCPWGCAHAMALIGRCGRRKEGREWFTLSGIQWGGWWCSGRGHPPDIHIRVGLPLKKKYWRQRCGHLNHGLSLGPGHASRSRSWPGH